MAAMCQPAMYKSSSLTLRELVLVAPSISSGCMYNNTFNSKHFIDHEGVGVGLTLVLPSEHGMGAKLI